MFTFQNLLESQGERLQNNLFQLIEAFKTCNEDNEGALPLGNVGPDDIRCTSSLQNRFICYWFGKNYLDNDSIVKKILNYSFFNCIRAAYESRVTRIILLQPHPDRFNEGSYLSLVKRELDDTQLKRYEDLFSPKFLFISNSPSKNLKICQNKFIAAYDAVQSFWSFFFLNKKFFSTMSKFVPKNSLVKDRKMWICLKKESEWYRFEAITRMRIPIGAIAKIGTLLKKQDRDELQDWVTQMNLKHQEISIDAFYDVLNEIMTLFKLNDSSTLTFQRLSELLSEFNCSFIHKIEANPVLKRSSLEENQSLPPPHESLRYGPELKESESPIHNQYVVRSVKHGEASTSESLVVKIGVNEMGLRCDAARGHNPSLQYGVPFVQAKSSVMSHPEHAHVNCMLLEKLHMLSDFEWTSDRWELNPKEQKYALILATFVRYMIENKMTIEMEREDKEELLDSLGFNKNGDMSAIHFLKKGAPNIEKWEKICLNVSKKHPYILYFLISVTGLIEHPFYLEIKTAMITLLRTGERETIGSMIPLCYNPLLDRMAEDIMALRAIGDRRKKRQKEDSAQESIYDSIINQAARQKGIINIGSYSFEKVPKGFAQLLHNCLALCYENHPFSTQLPSDLHQKVALLLTKIQSRKNQKGEARCPLYDDEELSESFRVNYEELKEDLADCFQIPDQKAKNYYEKMIQLMIQLDRHAADYKKREIKLIK